MNSGTRSQTIFEKLLKIPRVGAGEVAQWVRALFALAEDLGSIPSIQTVAHSHL